MAMIVETHRGERGSHDWKSSPLAPLFHGLDGEMMKANDPGNLMTRGEMEGVARVMQVRFCRKTDGWGFVGRGREGIHEALKEGIGKASRFDDNRL